MEHALLRIMAAPVRLQRVFYEYPIYYGKYRRCSLMGVYERYWAVIDRPYSNSSRAAQSRIIAASQSGR